VNLLAYKPASQHTWIRRKTSAWEYSGRGKPAMKIKTEYIVKIVGNSTDLTDRMVFCPREDLSIFLDRDRDVDYQKFKLLEAEEAGHFKIVCMSTNKVFTTQGDNAPIILNDDQDGDNQKFQLISVGAAFLRSPMTRTVRCSI
jgi:hypothetical protein